MFLKKNKYYFVIFLIIISLFSTLIFAQNTTSNYETDIYKYEGYKIKKIEVEGLKNVSYEEVLMMLPFSENSDFDVYSFSKIIQILFSSGYFENIEVTIKPFDESSIIIFIKVKEFPIVYDIKFVGNKKVGKGDIEKAILIKKGDFYSSFLVKQQIDKLKSTYSSKGFENVEINISYEQAKDKNGQVIEGFVIVNIEIKEPKRIKITKIEFINNKVISSFVLKNKMKTKTFLCIIFEIRNGVFQEEQFNEDLEELKKLYYEKGYLDVKFENIEKKTIEKEDEIALEIYIKVNEGPQYFIQDYNILGNKVFDKEEILKNIDIKKNVPYNRIFFESLKERIKQYYANYGFIFSVVIMEEEFNFENKKVTITYTIFENSRAHLRNIYIKGNTKTKDYVILRELMFKEGEVFNVGKITQSIYNLYNTQYFSYLDVQIKPTDYTNIVDLIIIVEEAPTFSLKFGGYYQPGSGIAGLGLNFEFSQKNFLGMGYNISTVLNFSFKNLDLSFNFLDRWFLNQPFIFGTSLSYKNSVLNDQLRDNDKNGVPDPFTTYDDYKTTLQLNPNYYKDNPSYLIDYTKSNLSLSLVFGKRWIPFNSLSFGFLLDIAFYNPKNPGDFPWISSYSLIEDENTGKLSWKSFSIFSIYEFDSRDYILFAKKGIWFKERLDYFGGILGGDSNFIKSLTTFNLNLNLFNLFAFHSTLQLGLIFNQLDGKLNIDSQNYLYINGYYDVRGWMNINYLVGRSKFSWNNELEFEIFKNILNGVFYFDLGGIYQLTDDILKININNIYFSYGFGLRLLMQQFPIRLYIAKKFDFENNNLIDYNPGFFNWTIVFCIGDYMMF